MQSVAQAWLSLPVDERRQLLKAFIAHDSKIDNIDLVSAGDWGVFASLGLHFNYAVFGRDSLQVAEDLLLTHKALVDKIITTMARYQGVKTDLRSEEEPGKIHHEYRAKVFAGQDIPDLSLNIMRGLQRNWGDINADEVCYYGSYDATPMFIRLLGKYTQLYGRNILNKTVHTTNGQKTLEASLRSAVDWLVSKINSSEWKLLEFKRLNLTTGIGNQAWKDSATAYLHDDGEIANQDGGIASIELQGLAYDALQAAARLVAKDPAEQQAWLDMSHIIQQNTLNNLWLPVQNYFGQGLDRDAAGRTRVIKTVTSNPGALLDSNLLLDLPKNERQKYVQAIAIALSSKDLLTGAGIRCRSLKYNYMPGFIDYHGSYTVWPKETYTIAKGLRQHGLVELARVLEKCITASVAKAGEYYEFFYVNGDGQVWYDRDEAIDHFKSIGKGDNLALPERGQAWTISAATAIVNNSSTVPDTGQLLRV